MYTIYHNPACSKSRAALALLRDRGIEPQIILYLQTPPTVAELRSLLTTLGLDAQDIVRRSEPLARSLNIEAMPDEVLLATLVANPGLIERPIVMNDDHALIARPPERVLELI